MLNTLLTITSGVLNSKTSTIFSLVDKQYSDSLGTRYFAPSACKIYNNSGNDVYLGLYTTAEYNAILNSGVLSDLFPVYRNTAEVVNGFKDEITTVLVSGIVTGYVGSIEINFIWQ